VLEVDGLKVGCMGGAFSVDYKMRRLGIDWFTEESISTGDFYKLWDHEHLDLMVTHSPPQSVIERNFDRSVIDDFGLPDNWRDQSAVAVEELWRKFNYPPLFCGHMHRSVRDRTCRILDVNEVAVWEV
jgi:hypothetical protein